MFLVFLFIVSLVQDQQFVVVLIGDIIILYGIFIFGMFVLFENYMYLFYVNFDVFKGGEILESVIGGFDSYNFFIYCGCVLFLLVIMLEWLMDDVVDEQGLFYCLICDMIEYFESCDWVIFNLYFEVKFFDGLFLIVYDVLFLFELLCDKGFLLYCIGIFKMIVKVEVLDDYCIKFFFQFGYLCCDVIQQVGSQIVFLCQDFMQNKCDIE